MNCLELPDTLIYYFTTSSWSLFLSFSRLLFGFSTKKNERTIDTTTNTWQLMNILCLFVNCGSFFFRALYSLLSFYSSMSQSIFFSHLCDTILHTYMCLCVCKRIYYNKLICFDRFSSIESWLSSTLTPLNARANEIVSVEHMIQMYQKLTLIFTHTNTQTHICQQQRF